jgi:hypothetical protein
LSVLIHEFQTGVIYKKVVDNLINLKRTKRAARQNLHALMYKAKRAYLFKLSAKVSKPIIMIDKSSARKSDNH